MHLKTCLVRDHFSIISAVETSRRQSFRFFMQNHQRGAAAISKRVGPWLVEKPLLLPGPETRIGFKRNTVRFLVLFMIRRSPNKKFCNFFLARALLAGDGRAVIRLHWCRFWRGHLCVQRLKLVDLF